jgi:hypothetical protein
MACCPTNRNKVRFRSCPAKSRIPASSAHHTHRPSLPSAAPASAPRPPQPSRTRQLRPTAQPIHRPSALCIASPLAPTTIPRCSRNDPPARHCPCCRTCARGPEGKFRPLWLLRRRPQTQSILKTTAQVTTIICAMAARYISFPPTGHSHSFPSKNSRFPRSSADCLLLACSMATEVPKSTTAEGKVETVIGMPSSHLHLPFTG